MGTQMVKIKANTVEQGGKILHSIALESGVFNYTMCLPFFIIKSELVRLTYHSLCSRN